MTICCIIMCDSIHLGFDVLFSMCVIFDNKKNEKRNSPTPSSSSQNIHSVSLSWWPSGSHPRPFSPFRVLLLLSEHRFFILHWSPCHLAKSPTVLHDFYMAPRPVPPLLISEDIGPWPPAFSLSHLTPSSWMILIST